MPTFIIQGRFSAAAIKGMVSKPQDRRAIVQKLATACGGKLKEYYVTTGDKDFLIIVDAPDGSDAVVASLVAAASGAVSDVTTNRAWTTREFKKMTERAKAALSAYRAPG